MFRNFGLPELLIVLVIILLIFGIGRISKIAGELGSGIRAFREVDRAEALPPHRAHGHAFPAPLLRVRARSADRGHARRHVARPAEEEADDGIAVRAVSREAVGRDGERP